VLVLVTFVLALLSPTPQPTNPFTLDPIPAGSLPPIIGRTRTRALCLAIKKAVTPAVAAAMSSDKTYAGFRKQLFDYTLTANEGNQDYKIMQMDRSVQLMVKSTFELQAALDSGEFAAPADASQTDLDALNKMKDALKGVLQAQNVELDAMSGFVETERARLFGQLNETERNIQGAVGIASNQPGPLGDQSNVPNNGGSSFGFLQDSNQVFNQPRITISIVKARTLDGDLGQIAAYASHREDAASKVIIPATALCK
jgi:hypothetical protein